MKTITIFLTILLSCTAHAQNKAEIIRQISAAAQVAGIDTDLAVAIATTESGLNPKAVGDLGEVGLFQLRPEYHATIANNNGYNTMLAMTYLVQLKTKYAGKYGDGWFVLFNTGPYRPPKDPKATKYYQKVMKEVGQLKFKRFIAAR